MSDGTVEASDRAMRETNLALVRQGAVVLALTAAAVILGCGLVRGADGAFGAALGCVLVLAFFGVDVVVFLFTPVDAIRSTTVVVLLYVVKLAVFALVMIGIVAALSFDHRSFAVAVVIEAFVAVAVAARGFTRMRVPYVAP